MTTQRSPHFLLFAEAQAAGARGCWQFALSEVGGSHQFAAAADEPEGCRERLELLAVVRGLEALEEPARVTLVTNSRYVNRGLKRGLADWRAAEWRWERFGQLVPVRDADLWRRVDRALEFHELDCRLWRFEAAVDASTTLVAEPQPGLPEYPIRRLERHAHRSQAWHEPLEAVSLAAG